MKSSKFLKIQAKVWGLGLFVMTLGSVQPLSADTSSETITGRKGLVRLLSADINEDQAYHLIASMQYFEQDGLLKDTEDSRVRDTKAQLAIGYAILPQLHLSGHGGFRITSRAPQRASSGSTAVGGQETIDLVQAGLALTGTYDLGHWMGMDAKRFTTGLSLWLDLSKITRFHKAINVIPTLIFSSDWSDQKIPVRAHINAGFRLANGSRYYEESDLTVKDFDRFATNTINSPALTAGLGFEFPFEHITPSLEAHIEKVFSTSIGRSPKWITPAVKLRPFPQQNIEILGAADIGFADNKATASGTKPEVGPTPLWNIVFGFGISQFGKRSNEVGIDRTEYDNLKKSLNARERTIAGLQRDLEYNTVSGRVVDAETKDAISGVLFSFPDNPDLKAFASDNDGRFLKYFKNLAGARVMISKEGYETSTKFLALKPGERVTVDAELKKGSGQNFGDFVATITDANGSPISAKVTLTNTQTNESFVVTSDANGQLTVKVPEGSYRVEMKASGYKDLVENLEFPRGKTVLRSFSLNAGQ